MERLVRQCLTLAVLVVLAVALPAAAAPTNTEPSPAITLTADEALLVRLINHERAEKNRPALLLDPLLTQVARQHSTDMQRRDYFSHLEPAPNPRTPFARYADALQRRPLVVVGENIGRASQPLMAIIHAHMMDSPEHRANLLDPQYTRLGVGLHVLPDGRVWVTQMFSGAPHTR